MGVIESTANKTKKNPVLDCLVRLASDVPTELSFPSSSQDIIVVVFARHRHHIIRIENREKRGTHTGKKNNNTHRSPLPTSQASCPSLQKTSLDATAGVRSSVSSSSSSSFVYHERQKINRQSPQAASLALSFSVHTSCRQYASVFVCCVCSSLCLNRKRMG